jgi:hypothetical protein
MAYAFLITFFKVHISDFLLCKKWVAPTFAACDCRMENRQQPLLLKQKEQSLSLGLKF